jgi:hypothetical protein
MGRQLLALLLFSTASSAQVAVEGDVALRTTGQPLSGVRVLGNCPPETRLAATDPAGHFQFLGLPAGCVLTLDGPGLLQRGARIPLQPEGSNVSVHVAMRPQAVIAGKVLDENGWPVKGTITLAQYAAAGRLRQLLRVTSVQTDDLGAYRFGKLALGRYYIHIRPEGYLSGGDYLPAWYGSAAAEDAMPIDLKEGEEAGGIDVHLARGGGVEVRGCVTMPDGFQPSQARLTVAWEILNTTSGGALIPAGRDGSFIVRHVAPGKYIVTATTTDFVDGAVLPQYLAARTVVVSRENVSGIALNVVPPPVRDLPGTVVFEGGDLAHLVISMQARTPLSRFSARAKVNPDGSFVIPGAWPGPCRLQAMAPDGQVTSIRYGDQEVLNTVGAGPGPFAEFDFDGTPLPLRVTVTKAARIPGTVTGAAGQPIVGAALVLVPVGGVYEPDPYTRVQGQTREGGAFTVFRLLPGSYRVYVVEDGQDLKQSMADPGFLRSQEKAFPPLQVAAGDNPPLNLVMPSKQGRAAASLFPQRRNGVDLGCPPRRQVTGQHRHPV